MYRIGEFSILAKVTIKALRYYEKEQLLIPSFVDKETGYRFYETKQLIDLAKIISLRQIGMSINNIKNILDGLDINTLLHQRKQELESELNLSNSQLLRINYLLEEKNMKYEVILKTLPENIVYYKEGIIKDYSYITDFILSSSKECRETNPDVKCIQPDYCYINYLDGEYKDHDIKIRYAQAVNKEGIPNETIQFETLKPMTAACIYHKGAYEQLGEAYSFILNWIEEQHYEIIDKPRECYIDGIWNKENIEDWVTEIQVPIKKN